MAALDSMTTMLVPAGPATTASPGGLPSSRMVPRPCCLCHLDDRLAMFIADNPGSKRGDLVNGVGCSEAVLRRALPRLRAKGRIRQEGMRSTARYFLIEEEAV